MIEKADLRKIVILARLSDSMLEKLIPHLELLQFKDQQKIFDEGTTAKYFYMLKSGKVLLEKRISSGVSVSMGAIKPGYSFGWSAISSQNPFSMIATSAEDSGVFSIKGESILEILQNDHSMGFLIMQSLNRILKNRLDRIEEQFLRSIREHPDFVDLL